MSESPIEQLLGALDERDIEAAMSLFAPACRLLTVDGRRAEGTAGVRELLADFLATLRSSTRTVTAQWHEGDVWIAEFEGTYELPDRSKLGALPRACVLRVGPDGVAEVHAYGAHEHQLSDHRSGEQGLRIGGRWIPPL